MHSQPLTADSLIAAPLRSPAVPNASGTLALYTLSRHASNKELKVLHIPTGTSRVITQDPKILDAAWIPGTDEVVILKSLEGRTRTQVVVADAIGTAYVVGEIPAVSAVKLRAVDDGVAFVVVGALNDREKCQIYDSSAGLLDATLFHTLLKRDAGRWAFAFPLVNLASCDGDFDVGRHGVAFICKGQPYFTPLRSPPMNTQPIQIDERGRAYNVRISPGDTVAFIYSTERGRSIYTTSTAVLEAIDVMALVFGDDSDKPTPDGFEFVSDDAMVVKSTRHGQDALSYVSLVHGAPRVLPTEGTIHGCYPLGQDELLVSSSSFVDTSLWQAVSLAEDGERRTVSSATRNGAVFGLEGDMVVEFWYEGDGRFVQSWMVRPSRFDEGGEYPWIMIPRGKNGWSTTWNVAAWAELGYIVICPDVRGPDDVRLLLEHVGQLAYLDMQKAVLVGALDALGDVVNEFCCAVWDDTSSPGRIGTQSWTSAPPTLVVDCPRQRYNADERYHGDRQALDVFDALQAQGVPSRLLVVPGGDGVMLPENALVWHRTVKEWLRRCVEGDLKRG